MLETAGQTVEFVDVRDATPGAAFYASILKEFGEEVVNRRSTTWRGLDEKTRAMAPEALLAAHPSLMKRPVIEADGALYLGWSDPVRQALLGR